MATQTDIKSSFKVLPDLSLIVVLIVIIIGILFPFNSGLKGQNQENENVRSTKESDTLYVKEILLAKDVVERQPIDVVQTFDLEDDTGWCFAKIYNDGPMRDVNFKWYHEGDLYYTFEAKVGSSKNWRTYSSVTLREGSWRIELTGPEDNIMKEVRFHISE